MGAQREEGMGREMMNLRLGALGCSVITDSQDTDFGWICKSWSHCLTGGRSHHSFITRACAPEPDLLIRGNVVWIHRVKIWNSDMSPDSLFGRENNE